MTRNTLVRAALAVLTCVAALTACGGGTEGHNKADVTFAQQMIPHHSQAVRMADLVDGRTTNPKIVDLADRVRRTQNPEITTMTGWLTTWGEPAAEHHSGHGSMPGMMSEQDMADLTAATGADFDRRWLTLMIAHHQGAIDMATTELARGSDPGAKDLAQRVIDAQQAEIREMRDLLPRG